MARKGNRRRKREGDGHVPLDSFSDIAFLLIIFFMIATTLVKTYGFLTDLPAGEENEGEDDKVPTITLSGEVIMYNESQVTMDKLREKLFDLKLAEKDEAKRFVMLEAESTTLYKNYFPVWAAIVKAGGIVAIVEAEE